MHCRSAFDKKAYLSRISETDLFPAGCNIVFYCSDFSWKCFLCGLMIKQSECAIKLTCFSFYDFPGFSVFKNSVSAICPLSFSRERALIRYGLTCKSSYRKNFSMVMMSVSQKYDSVSIVGLRRSSSSSSEGILQYHVNFRLDYLALSSFIIYHIRDIIDRSPEL